MTVTTRVAGQDHKPLRAAQPMGALRTPSCATCPARTHGFCQRFDAGDLKALASIRMADRFAPAGSDVVDQGEANDEFYVVSEGWAMAYEILPDGGRQILNFILPGEIVGFSPDSADSATYSVQALTGVKMCSFSRSAFVRLIESHPRLGLRLACVLAEGQRNAFRHLTLVGRRNAKERVAALLFELYVRLRVKGVATKADAVHLPLTQEQIGDAIGLTNVHVNRMLRELREEGVLDLKRGTLKVLDPEALADIAGSDFDTGRPERRAA